MGGWLVKVAVSDRSALGCLPFCYAGPAACVVAEMQPTVALSRLYTPGMWSEENAIPIHGWVASVLDFLSFGEEKKVLL